MGPFWTSFSDVTTFLEKLSRMQKPSASSSENPLRRKGNSSSALQTEYARSHWQAE